LTVVKPIIDAVMKDAGLSNEGITGVAHSLSGFLKKSGDATGEANT